MRMNMDGIIPFAKLGSGGGGEPAAYIKDATVTSTTLKLTKKDGSVVNFKGAVSSVNGRTGNVYCAEEWKYAIFDGNDYPDEVLYIDVARNTWLDAYNVGSAILSEMGSLTDLGDECYMRIRTAATGTVDITMPEWNWIGEKPVFGNGEMWDISLNGGVAVAAKVTINQNRTE